MQSDELCLESLLSMEDDAFPDMMEFAKQPDFFDIDFIMGSEWSDQCSPDHSVFSSPAQYPQLLNGMPDEDVLLPASAFDIDSPNYVSNLYTLFKKAYG